MSTAEEQRRWRAKQGARTGEPGRRPTEPCGTWGAIKRHRRSGEDLCAECAAEETRRNAANYQRRKGTQVDPGTT